MNNYRVNFGGSEIDYKANFKETEKYYPILEKIYTHLLDNNHVDYAWHFFEPYTEVTWVSPYISEGMNSTLVNGVVDILSAHNITPSLIHYPKDGNVVDWYCKSDEEREFGYKSYTISAKMAMLFWKYKDTIASGCGKENQFVRRAHVLANQLGFNYEDEARLLAKRADLCDMFYKHGHEEAVKMYEEKYNEKYK